MCQPYQVIVLSLLAIATNLLGGEPRFIAPSSGVLVLRNGFVLQGRITEIDGSYMVSTGDKSEARLPVTDVAFHCATLDEAYLKQRESLATDDAAVHLALAEWCLRHGLLDRAADQLLIVFSSDPQHPRLGHLERRLLAVAAASRPTDRPASSAMTIVPVPESHTLQLPPRLMQQFTTVVQPILLNRCASFACHGTGTNAEYQLIRSASGSATTSRMTLRNVHATMSYVDHSQPDNSLLLAQAQRAHGGAKTSPISEKQSQQLELLTAWIRSAAMRPTKSIAVNRGGPRQFAEHVQSRTERNAPQTSEPSVAAPAVAQAGYAQSVKPALQEGTPNPNGGDPFDAEVFNRRFHPPHEAVQAAPATSDDRQHR